MNETERVIILKPHPLGWLYHWVICVLTIPLFGIGLVAGFFLWKHIRSISYRLGDADVSIVSGQETITISWGDVSEVYAESRAGRLGHIVIISQEIRYRLTFLEDAFSLAETINHMLASRHKMSDVPQSAPIPQVEMSVDRLNDLTALWQQGLISEEDYQKERRHFI
jgi:hypothetical protein